MFNEIGDVSLILKRDQRTIKNLLVPVDTVGAEFCGEYKKGGCNKFSIRLVQAFIFGVCFLTIVRIPTAMTAPMSCRDRDGAKWKNPCGQKVVMEDSGGSVSSENDVIHPILWAARIALDQMLNFRENYVRVTFQAHYNHHATMWKQSRHNWLPDKTEVPKNLGEKVDVSHLESQKLDQFLQSIYESMQKYAVGIEQVVIDQENMSGSSVPNFRSQFNDTEAGLRKVLCELRSAMDHRNIVPLNKVDRCIMDLSTRRINGTAQRNLRDWIIFKECMNGLEYLIEVLEYLEAKSRS